MFDITVVVEKLKTLDLTSVRARILRKEGWVEERLVAAEEGYREFLTACLLSPEKPMGPPNDDVDVVWHYHILDTMRYERDCQELFGHFLHHVPTVPDDTGNQQVTCNPDCVKHVVQMRPVTCGLSCNRPANIGSGEVAHQMP